MTAADVKARIVGGAAVLYPGAYLNRLKGEVLENRCQEFLIKGVRRLVINFEETELINSIGISILLGVIEAVNAANGILLLSNLNDSNRELFEMLGLLSHIQIEESEQMALAKLSVSA